MRLYGLFFVLLSKKAFSACLVAKYCERCGPAVPAGNGDIRCENVIKQLDIEFALDKLCLKKFFAIEAAMAFSVLAYNLCVLFQGHLGWMDRVTAATLRFRLFTTGGIISKRRWSDYNPPSYRRDISRIELRTLVGKCCNFAFTAW